MIALHDTSYEFESRHDYKAINFDECLDTIEERLHLD